MRIKLIPHLAARRRGWRLLGDLEQAETPNRRECARKAQAAPLRIASSLVA